MTRVHTPHRSTTCSSTLRIFVISLKRRTDRAAHMQALLAERGLKAEFIEAVDGAQMSDAQWARYDRDRSLSVYGADMNAAELGCHLSHMECYSRIVAEGLDVALVLEDDIECDVDLAAVLDSILAAPRPDWQVLRLQSTKGCIIRGDKAATRGDRNQVHRGRTISRIRAGILGGCGYLIRNEGARRMLAYAERPFMPIDQTMDRYWENGIQPYVLRPFPVRQSPRIHSEIAARKEEQDLGPYWTAVRRVQRLVDSVNKRAYQLVQLDGWREVVNLPAAAPVQTYRPAVLTSNG